MAGTAAHGEQMSSVKMVAGTAFDLSKTEVAQGERGKIHLGHDSELEPLPAPRQAHWSGKAQECLAGWEDSRGKLPCLSKGKAL